MGGDNGMSENSVCVSYFFFRFIPIHGGAWSCLLTLAATFDRVRV